MMQLLRRSEALDNNNMWIDSLKAYVSFGERKTGNLLMRIAHHLMRYTNASQYPFFFCGEND